MRLKLFNMKQMKTNSIGILTLLLFLAIPLTYNSCQGGMRAAQQSMQLSSLCVQKTSPFAVQKNAITQSTPTGISAKTTLPDTIDQNTQIVVLLNNFCAQDNTNSSNLSYKLVRNQKAMLSSKNVAGLNKQAYLWTLERAYSKNEISQIADSDSCVLGVSLNKKYKIKSTTSPSVVFDDPGISNQQHWQALNYVEAYPRFFNDTTGITTTGDDILVAVVDTGFDVNSSSASAHPDLHANLWRHQLGDGVDATTIGTQLVNFAPVDVSTNGHGTHLSGLIGAITNNNVGVMGMIPRRVKIMAVKVFAWDSTANDITSTSQAVANGIRFAYLNGAKVINLSLGIIFNGVNDDPIMKDAIQDAVAAGAVVVNVIGNADSGNGSEVNGNSLSSIPGQYGKNLNGMITVGSVDADSLLKSYFSHYSYLFTEMMAPGANSNGVGLYSTVPLSSNSSGYGRLMGTSQAAPLVSGAAAMIMQYSHDRTGVWPSPAAVESFMKANTTKSTALVDYVQDGNLLDLDKISTALQGVNGSIGPASTGFDCF